MLCCRVPCWKKREGVLRVHQCRRREMISIDVCGSVPTSVAEIFGPVGVDGQGDGRARLDEGGRVHGDQRRHQSIRRDVGRAGSPPGDRREARGVAARAPQHGYEFVAPLDEKGHLDSAGWPKAKATTPKTAIWMSTVFKLVGW